MTLLLSWIGKDSRKISSFYIASDSRLSWGGNRNFDFGRKVYALPNSPEILGYCGDVVYPTIILGQIIEMDKNNILFPSKTKCEDRSEILFNEIKKKFNDYPSSVINSQLEILHVSRDNETNFLCKLFKWTKETNWIQQNIEIPDSSEKVIILGSGEHEFYEMYLDYYKGNNGKTSRALFQCLCHILFGIKDPMCGGAPQLVGLYNKFNGKDFGIIYNGRRYFLGKELEIHENLNNIEWRNELFERCDGNTTEIINGAQRQPNELRP